MQFCKIEMFLERKLERTLYIKSIFTTFYNKDSLDAEIQDKSTSISIVVKFE